MYRKNKKYLCRITENSIQFLPYFAKSIGYASRCLTDNKQSLDWVLYCRFWLTTLNHHNYCCHTTVLSLFWSAIMLLHHMVYSMGYQKLRWSMWTVTVSSFSKNMNVWKKLRVRKMWKIKSYYITSNDQNLIISSI